MLEEHIVIQPTRGRKEKTVPPNGLLLVNPSEALPIIGQTVAEGGKSRTLFNSKLCVAGIPPYFLAGPSIGAPMAVITLEKLIALGARKIILCGWCGAIDPAFTVGDIVVPDNALIGEGTSAYYTDSPGSSPSVSLSDSVVKLLTTNNKTVLRGCVWSTDAIYREDRTQLQALSADHGVVAVDMEFSALCSVALFRGVEFSAVLVVSDEIWGKTWRPGFSNKIFVKNKESLLTVLKNNVSHL